MSGRNSAPESTVSQSAVLGWLLPPLFLGAIGLAVWLIFSSTANYFAWGAGFLVTLSLLWVLISTVFPRGPVERICPACGRDTLVRSDSGTTIGLVCKSCLWKDDQQSSFLLAEEEEEPIETTVLERRRKQAKQIIIRPWTGPTEVTSRDSTGAPPAHPDQPQDPS